MGEIDIGGYKSVAVHFLLTIFKLKHADGCSIVDVKRGFVNVFPVYADEWGVLIRKSVTGTLCKYFAVWILNLN